MHIFYRKIPMNTRKLLIFWRIFTHILEDFYSYIV